MSDREPTYDLAVFVFKAILYLVFGVFWLIYIGIKALVTKLQEH